MIAPTLRDVCRAICCPKRAARCKADDENCIAEEAHFAAAVAVRALYNPKTTGE